MFRRPAPARGSMLTALAMLACTAPFATADPTTPNAATPASVTVERERILMGTRCSIVLMGTDQDALETAATAAFATIAHCEDVASNWRGDSELARFTRASTTSSGRPVAVSADLFDVLARATAWAGRSDGAFDATVEPLTALYDLRGKGRVPSEAERAKAAKLVQGRGVRVDAAASTITVPARGVAFDLGGIAKGWAIDRAVETLRAHGVTRALVNFGGQVYALGSPVGADAWTVELASPGDRGRGVVTLRLRDQSLSTTAASEHALTVDGVTINHIIDPRTGRPSADWGSASAIAATGTDADCASTALYVMGAEAGLAWAQGQPDLEAVMLVDDPASEAGVRIERTNGPTAVVFTAAAAKTAADPAPSAGTPDNAELARRVEVLAGEVEDLKLGDVAKPAEGSSYGLGPAASKVYGVKRGVSIGGYGEMLYETFAKTRQDGVDANESARLDFARAIVYFGYKFSDKALFNSEVEFEHGSTELQGSVSVEFAYLDFLVKPAFNVRAGMLLAPVGFLNELHEPPIYLGARRPEVEKNILPSTWRANGAGIHGDFGNGLSYRAYVTESFRGVASPDEGIEGFTAEKGVYEGRQNGSESIFDQVGLTGRVDWAKNGFLVGASAFTGGAAQNATTTLGEPFTARTTLYEAHAEYKNKGLWLRALGAGVAVDEAEKLNDANGYVGDESIGSKMFGAYGEAAYDILKPLAPGSALSLMPYVRYERYDTQNEVPAGFLRNPANDRTLWTLGAAFYPDPQIVIKTDFEFHLDGAKTGTDQANIAVGYLF